MARTTPLLPAFTTGETSPKTDGRLDLEDYFKACSILKNMIPQIQGPADKRPGTYFIAEVKNSSYFHRLIPFQYSAGDNYNLEFGEYTLRFYTQGGIVMDGENPYEIATPYEAVDLDLIKLVQVADTVYLVHPLYPTQILVRFGPTTWTIVPVTFVWGPFLAENEDEAVTITPSAVTGIGISLTASSALFDALHVGAFFKLKGDYVISGSMSATDSTVGNMELNAGETMNVDLSGTWVGTVTLERSFDDGSTWFAYVAFTTNTTQSLVGISDDVLYRWKFTARSSGTCEARLVKPDESGYVMITHQADPTHATANVIEDLASIAATFKWSEGAFSDYQGYPAAIRFYEQRLELAGTYLRPVTILGSRVDDYPNFQTGPTDDHAYTYTLAGAKINQIIWMLDSKILFIGTMGDEWRFGFADAPTTNTNVDAKRESEHGSAAIQPLLLQNAVVFVEAGGRALRAITYLFEEDSYLAPRLSDHAEHLLADGIVDLAFQAQPAPVIWMVRNDGYLVSCTFDRRRKMAAYARHYLGGIVESLSVIRGTDRDEVWVIVKRWVDGSYRRYVEQMQTHAWQEHEDAFYVDSGLSYDGYNATAGDLMTLSGGSTWQEGEELTMTASGAHTPFSAGSVGTYYKLDSDQLGTATVRVQVTAYTSSTVVTVKLKFNCPAALQATATVYWAEMATGFTGLTHLKGEPVSILTDGAVHAPQTVSAGGEIALDWPAAVVHAGLKYQALLKTKRMDVQTKAGTSQGKRKAIFEVFVRLYKTLTCKVGWDEDHLDPIFFRTTKTPLGSPPDLFTGDKKLPMRDRGANEATIALANDDPVPFTVVSIAPTMYASEL